MFCRKAMLPFGSHQVPLYTGQRWHEKTGMCVPFEKTGMCVTFEKIGMCVTFCIILAPRHTSPLPPTPPPTPLPSHTPSCTPVLPPPPPSHTPSCTRCASRPHLGTATSILRPPPRSKGSARATPVYRFGYTPDFPTQIETDPSLRRPAPGETFSFSKIWDISSTDECCFSTEVPTESSDIILHTMRKFPPPHVGDKMKERSVSNSPAVLVEGILINVARRLLSTCAAYGRQCRREIGVFYGFLQRFSPACERPLWVSDEVHDIQPSVRESDLSTHQTD